MATGQSVCTTIHFFLPLPRRPFLILNPFFLLSHYLVLLFHSRFSGGFGARDYRQTSGGGGSGGGSSFGGRGNRSTGSHGGNRGFGGGKGQSHSKMYTFSVMSEETVLFTYVCL